MREAYQPAKIFHVELSISRQLNTNQSSQAGTRSMKSQNDLRLLCALFSIAACKAKIQSLCLLRSKISASFPRLIYSARSVEAARRCDAYEQVPFSSTIYSYS